METKDDLLQELYEKCEFAEAWPDEKRKLERNIERNIRAAALLGEIKIDFEEGDLLAPISAMSFAYEWGFTVPLWANQYLAEAFNGYLDEGYFKGSAKLESFLGLSGARPFSRQSIRSQYEGICNEIGRLNRLLKFNLPISYMIVKQNIAKHLSISQLTDIYKVHGKHTREDPLYFFSFRCDSLKELKKYLLSDHTEFQNELFESGLQDAYIKQLVRIIEQFKPGQFYGDIPNKIGG